MGEDKLGRDSVSPVSNPSHPRYGIIQGEMLYAVEAPSRKLQLLRVTAVLPVPYLRPQIRKNLDLNLTSDSKQNVGPSMSFHRKIASADILS